MMMIPLSQRYRHWWQDPRFDFETSIDISSRSSSIEVVVVREQAVGD